MKKLFAFILALVMVVALAACGGQQAQQEQQEQQEPVEEQQGEEPEKASIKLGNTQTETDLQSQSILAVKDKVEKATDGNFEVKAFFNSSLGETDDILEQAIQGANVVSFTDPSRLANYVPEFGILGMPYIMDDYTGLNKIMDTDMYREWMQGFEEQGIWIICANWYSGARNFTLNKVIKAPADLAGERIRTIGNEICTTSVDAMGAVATPMSWSEVYQSISQGALDGAEVQTSSFYATRLWEVVNTINRTEHFQLSCDAATGTIFRDSLSADYQKLLSDIFYEVGVDFQEKTVKICADWEKEMVEKYGLTLNEDVDVQAFKDASAPVYEKLGMEEVRNRLQTEMAKAN